MSPAREILDALVRRVPSELPVALVAAHPDDETIGFGASLRLFPRMLLVHVTDGAPRNLQDARDAGFDTAAEYAQARRRELAAALKEAGAKPELAELGATDQEASLHLAELAAALAEHFADFRPACVFSHSYEGGHPDHDAACFITQEACRRLDPVPAILEMTSYHAGLGGEMILGGFVGEPAAAVIVLDDVERVRRREMLDCFVTQGGTLDTFRDMEHEAFRVAPTYDFEQPPHPGGLWYERHAWGMTGARWRALAGEALALCRGG